MLVDLNRPKKIMLATLTGLSLIRNPRDIKGVVRFGELLRELIPREEQERYLEKFTATPVAAQAVAQRMRLTPWDWDAITCGDDNSLGRQFANFLLDNNIHPDTLPLPEVEDDFSYMVAHLTETHDIMHVLLGFDCDLAGELGVIGFFSAQINSPLYLMLISGGLLNAAIYHPTTMDRRMQQLTHGWDMGKKAMPLFGIDWSNYWQRDIDEVRRELAIAHG